MFESIIEASRNNSNVEDKKVIKPISDLEDKAGVRISVIGVGGGGCNAVNRLYRNGITGANTIAINTDGKQLNIVESNQKILIGKMITNGLGAGGDQNVARKAAEADAEKLREKIGENQLVFLCAGMGGGTGTGAAPVIARIAKEQGAIVIAMVTYPFALERVRLKKAQEGIRELAKIADTVVIIDNNRLNKYASNMPINKAFAIADSIISRAVKGITDTILLPSLMNVDYADVKSVMESGGLAMISLGHASGMDKIENVIKDTLEHPLLDVNYENAKGCLLHLEGDRSITLSDFINIGEKITDSFDKNSSIKMGARINPDIHDEIFVTAIITGISSPNILGNNESNKFNGEIGDEENNKSKLGIDYL